MGIQRNICIQMFIAALFPVAERNNPNVYPGTSLAIQRLGLGASTARDTGLIPGY